MRVKEMIATHPDVQGDINAALLRCIEDCHACAQACTSCADACLAEDKVAELRPCRICAEACRRCEQSCREAIASIG